MGCEMRAAPYICLYTSTTVVNPGFQAFSQEQLVSATQASLLQQQQQAAGADYQTSSKKRKLDQVEADESQQPNYAAAMATMPPPQAKPSSSVNLMPPPRKRSEDDAWVLPRRGMQQALKAAGLDKDFKLEVSVCPCACYTARDDVLWDAHLAERLLGGERAA